MQDAVLVIRITKVLGAAHSAHERYKTHRSAGVVTDEERGERTIRLPVFEGIVQPPSNKAALTYSC